MLTHKGERLSLQAAGPPALSAALRELSPLDYYCCSIVVCRMVVQVIVYAVSCVVVFLRLSNRCATVFCVVSHFDKVIVMLASACVCCLFYVGASFVNLGVAWDSIVFFCC